MDQVTEAILAEAQERLNEDKTVDFLIMVKVAMDSVTDETTVEDFLQACAEWAGH